MSTTGDLIVIDAATRVERPLPPPLRTDFNRDGVVDSRDISAFLGVWQSEAGRAGGRETPGEERTQ